MLGLPAPQHRQRAKGAAVKEHIPPDLVVERFSCSSKAARGEDLQVEHPVWCGDAPAFHFHATLAGMLRPTLIGDQVIEVRQPCYKCLLSATGMVKAFHREQFALHGVMRLIQQRASRWHLRILEHGIPASFLLLKPTLDTLTVGRGGSSVWVDVQVFASSKVSREHFRLRRDRSGLFFIQDASSWGTAIDGVPIPPAVKGADGVLRRGAERAVASPSRIELAGTLTMHFEARSLR